MGKTIYLSAAELDLLAMVFDYGNYSCEGSPDEEQKMEVAENIRKKVNKALYDR